MASYESLAARRSIIVQRCLIAVQKYAVYISNEAPETANHANRLAWAKDALRAPDGEANAAAAFVLGNQDFIDADLGLADSALQGIVETAINDHFIEPA